MWEQGSCEKGWLMWQQTRIVWKGLVGIAGKLDKIYIMKCPKYMYGN